MIKKPVVVKPMAHQKASLKHDKANPAVFDMSDPGTGKTGVRILAFSDRRRAGGGCLLVLAPRSLLRTAWGNDFEKFAPHLKVSIATAANRAQALAVDADVYITNHDAVNDLTKMPASWWAKFDEFVVDEGTAFKHHTSQRSRAMGKIAHLVNSAKRPLFKHRAVLTATPISNGICDIWHQVYLLDGGKRLGPSFYGFRNSVCEGTQVGRDRNAISWRDKVGAEEAVFGLINDIVIRHKFEDCVDIPETHQWEVEYEMNAKHRKVYETMLRDQLLELRGAKITAVNAAAVTTKILQIASGAVYAGDGTYVVVDTGRYETLIEMATHRRHPLMLFFWQHQKDLLIAEATKRGLKYAVFDGTTNDKERAEIVMRYQANQFDILFGHPKTIAHGLTLTEGTSVIWPGPTYDLEWWKQANKRQSRIGQTRKTEVVTMLAKDTYDEEVYWNICMRKDGRQGNLLDLFDLPRAMARKLTNS